VHALVLVLYRMLIGVVYVCIFAQIPLQNREEAHRQRLKRRGLTAAIDDPEDEAVQQGMYIPPHYIPVYSIYCQNRTVRTAHQRSSMHACDNSRNAMLQC
jgi:hypothetical protein